MASAGRRTTLIGIGAVLAMSASTAFASAVPGSVTSPGPRSVSGTEGDDVLVGTPGPDTIDGLGGDDVLIGMQGDDVLIGGPGDDRLVGGPGDDTLIGDIGRDVLVGGPGADALYAADGDRDIASGGAGSDTAWGDPSDHLVAESVLTFAKPIVFDRGQTTSPFDWDVWSMAPDGTGQLNLTNDPAVLSRNPTISPLGTKIAFERESASGDLDVWVMNIDGSGQVSLGWNSPFHDLDAAWSPDGTKLAFSSTRDGDAEIYVANADGTGTPTQLTFNTGIVDDSPTWAPGGSKIAFSSGPFDFSTDFDIWTMNANGSGQAALTTDATYDDWYPDWSPDGSIIVWSRIEDVPAGITPHSWLYRMASNGTGQPLLLAPNVSLYKQLAPGWCPNGDRVVFVGSTGELGGDIYAIDPDGTGLTQLTFTTAAEDDFFPDCGG